MTNKEFNDRAHAQMQRFYDAINKLKSGDDFIDVPAIWHVALQVNEDLAPHVPAELKGYISTKMFRQAYRDRYKTDVLPSNEDIQRMIYLFMSYCTVNKKINDDPSDIAEYILARWNEKIEDGQEES